IKEQLIKVLAHDIRSPLISGMFIADYIHQQIGGTYDEKNSILPEMSSDLKETLKSVYEYVNDFLTWYNHKSGIFNIQLQEVDFTNLVEEVIRLYHPLIKRKSNELTFQVDKGLKALGDHKLLSIVIRNILDNANKYTSRSFIKILVSDEPNHINFKITNRAEQ
uniref:sensor histidine kinase n=1 Tax=Umezakia ovalisporum TaxID=75695 RepID=UPI0039C6F6FD